MGCVIFLRVMSKKVVDPTYAKSKDYAKVLNDIQSDAKCPFCPDNFKYHKNPILKKDKTWIITQSSWPYKNSQNHFLIICKKHKEEFSDLKASDFKSVMALSNWAIKKFNIKGGALALRFGETSHTGATVCHLHFHLIIPEINKKTKRAKTIQFPIG
jgi:diadenosine tetraphosphate (Ap4A) HIT family hydrolase